MQIKSRLEKLETIHLKGKIAAITSGDSSEALLSTGMLVERDELNKYPNLVLFEFNQDRLSGERLRLIAGNVANITSSTLAKLIVGWRRYLESSINCPFVGREGICK